jgi:hypothetical protein
MAPVNRGVRPGVKPAFRLLAGVDGGLIKRFTEALK